MPPEPPESTPQDCCPDIPLSELTITAVRAQGPGGQHVNKTSSAVQLRFDISSSSALTAEQRQRLLTLRDRRISRDGVVIIKAQRSRSREANRQDALRRLQALLRKGLAVATPRRKTRPSKAARKKRVDNKTRRGKLKSMRKTPDD